MKKRHGIRVKLLEERVRILIETYDNLVALLESELTAKILSAPPNLKSWLKHDVSDALRHVKGSGLAPDHRHLKVVLDEFLMLVVDLLRYFGANPPEVEGFASAWLEGKLKLPSSVEKMLRKLRRREQIEREGIGLDEGCPPTYEDLEKIDASLSPYGSDDIWNYVPSKDRVPIKDGEEEETKEEEKEEEQTVALWEKFRDLLSPQE